MRILVAVVSCVAILTAATGIETPAGERELTLDWIFSDEGKSAASVPDHAWLDDGTVLLYDQHPPATERTLESFDPETGKRTRLVDPVVAVESLTALLEPEEPLEELGWPAELNPRGGWAIYSKKNAVFLLEFETSQFSRVGSGDSKVKTARFSPDGSKLAYVQDNDLYVRGVVEAEAVRLTHDGTDTLLNGTVSWVYWEEIFGRRDLGYYWSPDSTAIAFLQTDESGVGLMSYVDFEPNVPRVIHQRYPKTGEANPRVRAGVVELESKRITWVDLGVYPYEYLARVSWLPDGKRLAVQTLDRAQTTLDVFLAEAGSGKVSHLLRESDEGWVNLHDDLHFLEGRDDFVWVSERDGYAHLYLYEIDGGLVRQITKGEWAVRRSGRQAVTYIDEKQGWVYFTAHEKSSIEKQLYRIRLDGTRMERVTKEDGTHRVLFSSDGRRYLDAHSAIDRLPSLAVYLPGGDSERSISPARPELLAALDLQPRELFTVEAGDGYPLPAMILKPRDFDPRQRYPVVIYVYGGPSAPTVSHAWGGRPGDYFDQVLADNGFIVMRVDNRSATARSKRLENLILLDGYGTTELADLLDGVRWLKSQPWVDSEHVGIWGWSGGGSFTLSAMTGSDEFHAGVAVAAVTDWRYYDTRWAEAFMKRPRDNPEGYERTSHAAKAGQLHGRLLLVHGTFDDNVHPQNAWRFADELIEAGITFDMMIYPMRKHGIDDDAAKQHLYATMLEFWQRNRGNDGFGPDASGASAAAGSETRP